MKKYELVKGEKEDRRTIKLDKLLVTKIYKVDKKHGYISENDLYWRTCRNGWIENGYDGYNFSEQMVIIKKPLFHDKLRSPKYVKEFLTGTKIPLVSIRREEFPSFMYSRNFFTDTAHKELDMFVATKPYEKAPTTEQLWGYIEKHKNVEFYKNLLTKLLEVSKQRHQNVKEEETKQKLLIKEMQK